MEGGLLRAGALGDHAGGAFYESSARVRVGGCAGEGTGSGFEGGAEEVVGRVSERGEDVEYDDEGAFLRPTRLRNQQFPLPRRSRTHHVPHHRHETPSFHHGRRHRAGHRPRRLLRHAHLPQHLGLPREGHHRRHHLPPRRRHTEDRRGAPPSAISRGVPSHAHVQQPRRGAPAGALRRRTGVHRPPRFRVRRLPPQGSTRALCHPVAVFERGDGGRRDAVPTMGQCRDATGIERRAQVGECRVVLFAVAGWEYGRLESSCGVAGEKGRKVVDESLGLGS
mmetsp:Transcript_18734/g.39419  ORF Transcript_18734/g.39419 Transcript_18734/m.39419 type:complete len:280 (+) Transcript_18734:543-1382(+)